jgi:hypothetical protein
MKALCLYSSRLTPAQLAEHLPACQGPDYFHPQCVLQWKNVTTEGFHLTHNRTNDKLGFFELDGTITPDESGSLIGVRGPSYKPALLIWILMAIAMPAIFVGAGWPVAKDDWFLLLMLVGISLSMVLLFGGIVFFGWYWRVRALRLGLQAVFQGTLLKVTS